MSAYKNIPSIVGHRIRQVRMARALTQKAFADSLGIVQGYVSILESGKKLPSDTFTIAFCQLYGVNEDWFYFGQGEMFKKESSPRKVSGGVRYAEIPLLACVRPSFTGVIDGEEVTGYVSLPGVPSGSCAFTAFGDFMSPVVNDGDLVIFRAGEEVKNGDIVLVNDLWGNVILRRYRANGKQIFFSPDNSAYTPFKPGSGTKIIGRVVGVWREVKI